MQRAVLAVMDEYKELSVPEIVNKINERPELLPEGFTMGHGAVGAALRMLFDEGHVGHTIGEPVKKWYL